VTIPSGTKLGRYEIRSKIGAGGMGEVYLGLDTELDRKVALKILPAELAGRGDRMRRFTQEAKAAAALNHPNIAHVYEIGESHGLNFIAMEFIDGQTLRQCIHRREIDLKNPKVGGDQVPLEISTLATTYRFLDEAERKKVAEEKAKAAAKK
jgi:serine/threonine protein kinase